MRRRIATEHQIQSAFFDWVRVKAKTDIRFQNIIAIPNAGRRSWKQGKKMKAEGLSPGFPDVLCLIPNECFHGLAIEFKVLGGKIRRNQQEWSDRLNAAGYLALTAWSVDQAISFMESYLFSALPFREVA